MKNTKTLTRVALLVAIELVMKMVGLGSVPVGPLYMSFLTLPIAVGAITMGPAVGALLGGVFGAVSFYDAITGASAMTGALFQVSPVNTFILCVGMRVLMGLCCGLIFSGLKRFDKPGTWSYILSAMSAPFLNTVFFMGWIVLAFYGCDYVQNLVSVKGAANLHVRGAAGRRSGRGRVPCLRHSGRHRSPCCGKVRKIKDVPDVRAAHSIIVIKNSSGESWRSFFTTNISPA